MLPWGWEQYQTQNTGRVPRNHYRHTAPCVTIPIMADPFYLTISDRPKSILQVMDNFQKAYAQRQAEHKKRRWVPLLLFLAGFPVAFLDFLMGYNYCTFMLVALGLWTASLVTLIFLLKRRPGKFQSPQFELAREVINTLRDDVDTKRTFFGHLDLSGTRLESKLTATKENAAGRPVQHYRDEWLSLKGKLYDGNVLKMSVVEWAKVRKGYFKRGSSGKSKWRSEAAKTGQELKIRVSVNPQAYDIVARDEMRPGLQAGRYTIISVDTSEGIIQISASADGGHTDSGDLLCALRWAYYLLERRAA